MEPTIDTHSVGLASIAMISGILSQITSGTVLVWISIFVGLTTIFYNGIRIYKEFKQK